MMPTLEQTWRAFAEPLRRFLRGRVSDPSVAEDLLQDVFLKATRGLPRLAEPAKLPGWLFLIARRVVIDHYRTRKETLPLPDDLVASEVPDAREAEALQAAFRRMVHSLPPPYREAILLTEFAGLTQKEYAERMGISVSGAKSRVQRGRAELKKLLLDCCRFEFDPRGHAFDCEPRRPDACPECGPASGVSRPGKLSRSAAT
jgi:RNA polymerase sigma-70 factor (ECF subfamily)